MKNYMIRETDKDIVIRVNPEFMLMLAEISKQPLKVRKKHHELNVELSREAVRGFDKAVEIVDDYLLNHTE